MLSELAKDAMIWEELNQDSLSYLVIREAEKRGMTIADLSALYKAVGKSTKHLHLDVGSFYDTPPADYDAAKANASRDQIKLKVLTDNLLNYTELQREDPEYDLTGEITYYANKLREFMQEKTYTDKIEQSIRNEDYKDFLMTEILEQSQKQKDNPTPATAISIAELTAALEEHIKKGN